MKAYFLVLTSCFFMTPVFADQAIQGPIGFQCVNRSFLGESLFLELKDSQWNLKNSSCHFLIQKELPKGKNYQNWISLSPEKEDEHCAALTQMQSHPQRRITGILVSEPVQNGQKGYVRIEVDNSSEKWGPQRVRSFLACFPESIEGGS